MKQPRRGVTFAFEFRALRLPNTTKRFTHGSRRGLEILRPPPRTQERDRGAYSFPAGCEWRHSPASVGDESREQPSNQRDHRLSDRRDS